MASAYRYLAGRRIPLGDMKMITRIRTASMAKGKAAEASALSQEAVKLCKENYGTKMETFTGIGGIHFGSHGKAGMRT